MNHYFVISILVLWLFFIILRMIVNKKRGDYNLVIFFAALLGFGYFYLYDLFETTEFFIYSIITMAFFIISLIYLNIKQVLNGKISEFDYYDLEKDLKQTKSTSELLRKRFVSTIDLLEQGIAFREENNQIFGTDRYIDLFDLDTNDFNSTTLEDRIYKDDLIQYKDQLSKLTKRKSTYEITYRVKHKDSYVWIKERGKKIFLDNTFSIISIVKGLDLRLFPVSQVDVLNNMLTYHEMYEEVQKLIRLKQNFHLIHLELSNIPEVNKKYGRDVGDMMMGEYLKKLSFNFLKDNKSLFRTTGIRFMMIIKDNKKYEVLERALSGGGELLNMQMVFGGITQTLYPNAGVVSYGFKDVTADDLIYNSTKALDLSFNELSKENYCFYDKL
ncbi:hypothetical protein CI105_01590 [Candidatus Izimaplasma bacterium ZiA1]|uniref:PAS domain-containing protein n=1 Tax=Candidatus Izimoplasma sp. ZiA1 TaxID=2024899 RepID=UPI000BAA3D21|nr:hypothetical protein CI105_01590 [Candidatus Izimaplasma bacterium ZiA1]